MNYRRRVLGITQQQVSDNVFGLQRNAQFASNIERGKCQLPPVYIKKLANYLDVPLDEVIDAMTGDYKESLLHEIDEL